MKGREEGGKGKMGGGENCWRECIKKSVCHKHVKSERTTMLLDLFDSHLSCKVCLWHWFNLARCFFFLVNVAFFQLFHSALSFVIFCVNSIGTSERGREREREKTLFVGTLHCSVELIDHILFCPDDGRVLLRSPFPLNHKIFQFRLILPIFLYFFFLILNEGERKGKRKLFWFCKDFGMGIHLRKRSENKC